MEVNEIMELLNFCAQFNRLTLHNTRISVDFADVIEVTLRDGDEMIIHRFNLDAQLGFIMGKISESLQECGMKYRGMAS